MRIERFVLGAISTNCYFLVNDDTKEIVIVDPANCPKNLREYVEEKGYIPKAILLTHGHFDHIMGIDKWVEYYQTPVYLHEDEKEIAESAELNQASNFGIKYTFSGAQTFTDGIMLELAGIQMQVIHTPGHTKGGCCYYFENEKILLSGDTLFEESVGRTDFQTGSMSALVRSIREKLFCLPDDVVVYPGHGESTSIGHEKKYNCFI